MKNNIDDIINNLKMKYNYSDKLLLCLKKVIPTMINYYGVEFEDKIICSIMDCNIILTDDIYNSVGSGEKKLKIASGCFLCDAFSSKLYIKKEPDIDNFEFTNVSTFVHELCHCVKSGFLYSDDQYNYMHSGLAIEKQSKKEKTINEYYGEGLEEGLNAYDESCIMSSIFKDYKPESNNYSWLRMVTSKYLSENNELHNLIKKCQFSGDNSMLKEYLGEEDANELYRLCDINITYDIFECFRDKELGEKKKQNTYDIANIFAKYRDKKISR